MPEPEEPDPATSSAPVQSAPSTDGEEQEAPIRGAGEISLDELRSLGGELADGTARLYTAFQTYLEKKDEAGQEITDEDEQLDEDLEALQGAAERFNASFQNGVMSRLRRMGRSGTEVDQLRRKLARLNERGERVETQIHRLQPGPEVQREWQAVRRDWKRAGLILAQR